MKKFQLKPLARDAVEAALEKTDRYRLLGEPAEAESICRDVLEADPRNERALIGLVLALTDQFASRPAAAGEARSLLARLSEEYHRPYYAGIICERRAKTQLARGAPGSGGIAYALLCEAMDWYQKAEAVRPPANAESILRWNSCARLIMQREDIRPPQGEDFVPLQE